MRSIKTDNGGEYRSSEFLNLLRDKGITLKETVPYHSQTNPVAERTNRTLVTMARTALLHSNLPKTLWPEAVAHAAYTKNRTPHQTLNGKCPLDMFLPSLQTPSNIIQQRSKFRAFGETVWVHLPHTSGKLTARSIEGHIVRYTGSSGIYRVYTRERKITITKEPRHRETSALGPATGITIPALGDPEVEVPTADTPRNEGEPESNRSKDSNNGEDIVTDPESKSQSVVQQRSGLRRSGRHRRSPDWYGGEGAERAYLASTTPSITEALSGPDSVAWTVAMEDEKAQLQKYGVYEELDELPAGKQTIDTKWVLREKYDHTGKLEKRKAQLTARGFTQIQGLHYDDTYAPVARPDSWRTLLVLALRDDWIVLQADVVAAYLNAPLTHDIYISDPSVTKDKV